MCDQLSELRDAMVRYSSSFSADLLTVPDAARVVSVATAMESAIAAVKTVAAHRSMSGFAWRDAGYKSPVEALSHQTGVSAGQARTLLETGDALVTQPEVTQAALAGKITAAQTALISNAADSDPEAVSKLLEVAKTGSFNHLHDEVSKVKMAALADPEARRRTIHDRRRLSAWTDVEGVWQLRACGNPEDGAEIMAALTPITERFFAEARKTGRRDNPGAYAFDALVDLARTATTNPGSSSDRRGRRGAPAKIIVRVDYETLFGLPAGDDPVCEIVGYGPVPVSVVDDLLEYNDPFVTAVLTKAKALVGVTHLGRRPNARQQTALQWLFPACANQICSVQARLQADHRIDWAKTHETRFECLDLLCPYCHALKTRYNWALIQGVGRRAFVPPDDPRHPNHPASHPPPRE